MLVLPTFVTSPFCSSHNKKDVAFSEFFLLYAMRDLHYNRHPVLTCLGIFLSPVPFPHYWVDQLPKGPGSTNSSLKSLRHASRLWRHSDQCIQTNITCSRGSVRPTLCQQPPGAGHNGLCSFFTIYFSLMYHCVRCFT